MSTGMALAGAAVALALILILVVWSKRKRLRAPKPCAVCGKQASFGYSDHAEEDLEKIKPLCLECLVSQLKEDYIAFTGRAVVIEPAEGPPCYVFQPAEEWRKHFKKSRIATDTDALLKEMQAGCQECGLNASYLWVESHGLNGDNFMETLDLGLSETLLRHNPKPVSLCAQCCITKVTQELEARRLSYIEVTGPKGTDNGFIIPMGY